MTPPTTLLLTTLHKYNPQITRFHKFHHLTLILKYYLPRVTLYYTRFNDVFPIIWFDFIALHIFFRLAKSEPCALRTAAKNFRSSNYGYIFPQIASLSCYWVLEGKDTMNSREDYLYSFWYLSTELSVINLLNYW